MVYGLEDGLMVEYLQIQFFYNAECWSGVEYPNAAMSYYEGLPDQAFHIVDDVRARQDGTRRSPWNEVECGDFYSRQQSSWSLLDSSTGYFYNAPKNSITFAPKILKTQFTCFFITGTGWGTFNQTGSDNNLSVGQASLSVIYGQVNIKILILASTATRGTVTLNGNVLPSSASQQNGKLIITTNQLTTIEKKGIFKVSFSK